MKSYPAPQFAFFRIVFGFFLFSHFLNLLPYVDRIFSDEGMFAGSLLSPLAFLNSAAFLRVFNVLLCGAAAFFIIGFYRRLAAFVMWMGWTFFMIALPYISIPHEGYVGWLLLACVIVPSGEGWSRDPVNPEWRMPPELFYGAWLVFGFAYTLSGIDKLQTSVSWTEGQAMSLVFGSPIARPWVKMLGLESMPMIADQVLSHFAVWFEILYAPLFLLVPRLRLYLWTAMTLGHVALLVALDISDVSIAMIVCQLFLFDKRWLPSLRSDGVAKDVMPTMFVDGACGLCGFVTRTILRIDDESIYRVATLQSDLAARSLPAELVRKAHTLAVVEDGKLYLRSAAVLRILRRLGGLWRVLYFCLYPIPTPIFDAVYRAVSVSRRRLFGYQYWYLGATSLIKKRVLA